MPFRINCLDHVAITAKDMKTSADWYERVLGLKRYDVPEWGRAPVFLLAGTTGIALFPAKPGKGDEPSYKSIPVRIDHLAFNISKTEFENARKHYDDLGIPYTVSDHIHFHSIYTKDPDGHTVELTALVSDEKSFYG